LRRREKVMCVREPLASSASLAEVHVVLNKLRTRKHIVELVAMDNGGNFKSNEVG
jgi:hypothetical protein